MVNHAEESRVKISLRGYEGAQQRMSEIRARMNGRFGTYEGSLASPSVNESGRPTLSGSIGAANRADIAEDTSPMSPFAPGTQVAVDRAPVQLRAMINDAASSAGVDMELFEALIGQESNYNSAARSGAGAIGLAQLMPDTAKMLGVDPQDPAQNLKGGAKYLRQMIDQFSGNVELGLAAYNAGPGAVKRYGGIPPFKETQDYVRKVLARYQSIRKP
ncbi:MAG: lytic transglycosylase domain-containing protein [Chthonomonas sp.]|nr:lytic transglycosylase domain-containing protein [Chthonomonas sp.]